VPEDSRVLRERRLALPTSDRLETWLIPFGTTPTKIKKVKKNLVVPLVL